MQEQNYAVIAADENITPVVESFEFNCFIAAYYDYLTWVICFNDKARWG